MSTQDVQLQGNFTHESKLKTEQTAEDETD